MLFQQIAVSYPFGYQSNMDMLQRAISQPLLLLHPKMVQESTSPPMFSTWPSISPIPAVSVKIPNSTKFCGTPKKIFRPWDDDTRERNDVVYAKNLPARNSSCSTSNPQKIGFPSVAPSSSMISPPRTEDHHEKLAIENLATNLGKTMDGTHHRCIYCGKIYSRKYGLKIHLRTHTGFRPLKCKFCARPFGDPSNLNKHTRLHVESGDLNSTAVVYPCHVCKKSWSRKRDLERHMISKHARPKNMICNIVS